MKRKNTMAMVLATMMLLPASALAISPTDFSDFPNNWSAQAMTRAVQDGLLSGANGKINPNGQLTRAEMAAIISRAFGASAVASLEGYIDVPQDAWYYQDMAKAVQMGVFQGADGKLLPSNRITREEAFAVLARAFDLEDGSASTLQAFSDGSAVSLWAQGAVAALVENGYISGADGRLNPKAGITRAEFAQVMCNLVGLYVSTPETVTQAVDGNLVVREAGVTLQGLTIDGYLILADGIGAGGVMLDGVTIHGKLVVRGGADAVQMTGCTIADGITLTNPNAVTHIVAQDSQTGVLEVRSGLTLEGDISEIEITQTAAVTVRRGTVEQMTVREAAEDSTIMVAENAEISQITIDADGVRVDGKGMVKTVQANADEIAVTTPNTEVTAAIGTHGITAGGQDVQGGQMGKINANGTDAKVTDIEIEEEETPKGSKPSSGGNRRPSGGSSSDDDQPDTSPEEPDGDGSGSGDGDKPELACTAQCIDLNYAQYIVIELEQGTTLSDYTIQIDGMTVDAVLRAVDDHGRIVKWELENGWDLDSVHTVTITRIIDGTMQTIDIPVS